MMSSSLTNRTLIERLGGVKELLIHELHRRLEEEGYPDVRPSHGCVFRFIDAEGTRLTDLAERAGLTKQAVGEAVDDLAGLEYVERVPDHTDGRAKIIRLTRRGEQAQAAAARLFQEIQRDWTSRVGEERMAAAMGLLDELLEPEPVPA
jgi:DNA-binding MarR family transcriptional regulator